LCIRVICGPCNVPPISATQDRLLVKVKRHAVYCSDSLVHPYANRVDFMRMEAETVNREGCGEKRVPQHGFLLV